MKTTPIIQKILLIFSFMFLIAFAANAQADFTFEKTEHDFGVVKPSNDTIWYSFKFKNTSSEPLVISNIETACDCTLAKWPKTPIMPGKSAVIKGGYKLKGKSGVFNKTLTIMANTLPATTTLTIKGVIK
jgi:LEA14-like dessication related protein